VAVAFCCGLAAVVSTFRVLWVGRISMSQTWVTLTRKVVGLFLGNGSTKLTFQP
jgi:hypothetical protein